MILPSPARRRPGAPPLGMPEGRGGTMPDLATWRLVWEPRMLSILRLMTGLLFLEHGTAKIFDFPHQPDHKTWVLMTLVPGIQGLFEVIGGALITVGLFTRIVAFILAG